MKTSNRIRTKNSAAKVPAQTKTPAQKQPKETPWELIAARNQVYESYKRIRELRYECASASLDCLLFSIQHHPDLKPIIAALRNHYEAEADLNLLYVEYQAIEKTGATGTYTREQCHAIVWFGRHYDERRESAYTEALFQFSGLVQWVKNNPLFPEIAAALQKIVEAHRVLENFFNEERSR